MLLAGPGLKAKPDVFKVPDVTPIVFGMAEKELKLRTSRYKRFGDVTSAASHRIMNEISLQNNWRNCVEVLSVDLLWL